MNVEKTKQYFFINIALIALIGIIMMFSASYIYAKETFGSSTFFLTKQILFLLIGVGAALFVKFSKMSFWYKLIYFFNGISGFLLFLTMTPLGKTIKGSQRWLDLGFMSFQPGELVKITMCLTAIYYFNKFNEMSVKQRLWQSLHFFIPLGLLVLQPDFGTFFISSALIAFACFLSPFPRMYFAGAMVVGGISVASILVAAPYRVKRLLVFLDPWSDPQNSGFQIIQSYLAFANGHLFGQGIGNSTEKLFYLPEAHNDFILSVIGEEIGFFGVVLIVFLFFSFTLLGFKLAMSAKSNINKQIALGFVFLISFQAILNMGVVLGLLPTKGLNLPLISYGGTSLIVNMIAIGFIFSSINLKSQIFEQSEETSNFDKFTVG